LFGPKEFAVKGRPGGRSGFAGGIKISHSPSTLGLGAPTLSRRIRLRRDQRLQAVGCRGFEG